MTYGLHAALICLQEVSLSCVPPIIMLDFDLVDFVFVARPSTWAFATLSPSHSFSFCAIPKDIVWTTYVGKLRGTCPRSGKLMAQFIFNATYLGLASARPNLLGGRRITHARVLVVSPRRRVTLLFYAAPRYLGLIQLWFYPWASHIRTLPHLSAVYYFSFDFSGFFSMFPHHHQRCALCANARGRYTL
ncbi:hypothetical protein PLICRDRAFT_43762 [Plicaturopsis crispa FD-325 SS-3]|nr:hypothetical protein PLICRDRAFT_43762 [Plicaturopsis crispa FD-325 SS-3]